MHEAVVGVVVDAFEVLQVTGVGERIQVDDTVLRMVLDPVADEVGAYEAGAAGDEQVFHHVDPLSPALSRRERGCLFISSIVRRLSRQWGIG